jgi:hypothetical protein
MSFELEDLVAPPPRERFREELWERAQQQDRRIARRWRALAIVAMVVAAGALGTAGVLAFGSGPAVANGTYDRTASCPVPIQGGVPAFQLWGGTHARAHYNGAWHAIPAQVAVYTGLGSTNQLAAVAEAPGGFGFPSTASVTVARAPLTQAGLPAAEVFVKGDGLGSGNGMTCLSGSRITIRIHATLDSTNTPVAAKVAIRTGKKARSIAYLDWTPKRLVAYVSPDCRNRV